MFVASYEPHFQKVSLYNSVSWGYIKFNGKRFFIRFTSRSRRQKLHIVSRRLQISIIFKNSFEFIFRPYYIVLSVFTDP